MQRMLLALLPLAASGVYFFGWRVAAVLVVCTAAGFATEYITSRRRGTAVSTACFVTCALYALSLPPTVPLWIAVVGVVVAILFGKEVFGGFGRNFANPAIVGRAFVYICFPVELTARFVPVFKGFPGGLARWSYEHAFGPAAADAVSQASPLWVAKNITHDVSNGWQLLLGNIGGTWEGPAGTRILAAGSIGEGCAVLIVLAAVYLLVTKTANWRLMLSGLAGVVFASVLFRNVLGFAGVGGVPPLHINLLAGTALYATVFMVTDPVSAPKTPPAQLAYGFLIGTLMIVMRWRGIFVAAATFAILIGNLVGPLLDIGVKTLRGRGSSAQGGAA